MQLIIVCYAQSNRRLCGCMANGMKNAAKHVGGIAGTCWPFPDKFELPRSVLGAGGIASYCLGLCEDVSYTVQYTVLSLSYNT